MKNFIHYKDNEPINLQRVETLRKRIGHLDCYEICFHFDAGEPIIWNFGAEEYGGKEKRDKVYNYLKQKYSTDIEEEMKVKHVCPSKNSLNLFK